MFIIGGKKNKRVATRVVSSTPKPEPVKQEPAPDGVDLKAFLLQDNQEIDPPDVGETKPIKTE